MKVDERNRVRISLLFALCCALIAVIAQSKEIELLPDNPTRGVAEASIWFWENGGLARPELYSTFDQARQLSLEQPTAYVWQDRFSLTLDGRLFPKHAVLFSALIAPFYGVLGVFGFWFLNQLSLLEILLGVYALSRIYNDERSSLFGVGALLLATQLIFFSYGFNYDLFSSATTIWAFALARKRPVLSGAAVVLAFLVRPTNIVFGALIPIWLAVSEKDMRWKMNVIFSFTTSFLACVTPVLLFNYLAWGAPISGSYARLPTFSNGAVILDDTTHIFSFGTLASEFLKRMFFGSESIVYWYPSILLAVIGTWKAYGYSKLSRSFLTLVGVGIVFGMLMMGFPSWDGTGSWRFILPSVLIVWPLVCKAFEDSTGSVEVS